MPPCGRKPPGLVYNGGTAKLIYLRVFVMSLSRFSFTSVALFVVSLFLGLGAFFIIVPSADAATLYYVGTGDGFGTAANWHSSEKACDGAGDAGAAPGASDAAIFANSCDTSVTIPASTTVGGFVTQTGYTGTLTQAGTLTTGPLTIVSGATLDSAGFDLNVSEDWTNGGTYTSGSNTVTFNGSAIQNITTGGTGTGNDFNNVVINNTGAFGSVYVELQTNAIDIDGTFTLTDGAFSTNGENFVVVGTVEIANDGYLQFEGTETYTFTSGADTDSGNVYANNTTSNSPYGNAFYNLGIVPGNTFTLPATTDINGSLSIGSGAAVATGGNDITIAGNWSNSGTFTHGSAQVTFDGTSDQRLSGDTTFYDVVAAASSARVLELASGDTFTVANSLSLNGANASLLSVEATTAGSTATIAASGATESTSFLSLKDITLTGQVIVCDPGCINRGGNPGWIIPSEAPELSGSSSARVTYPNGGERWVAGGHYEVTWDMVHDDLASVSVFLSDDAGETWVPVAEDLDNTGFHECTVPDMPTKKALARVVGYDAAGNEIISDVSDRTFVIEEAEEVELTDEEVQQLIEELGSLFDDLFGGLLDELFTEVLMTDVEGNDVSLLPGGLFRGETLSGVYMVNADGTRSVFPNERVFISHGYSFDDVVTVTDDQLQKLDLGSRVTMASGSLVKIRTDNRVFEVGTGGTLHHVTSEEVAVERYGDAWNQIITDIDDIFWSDYTIGEAL